MLYSPVNTNVFRGLVFKGNVEEKVFSGTTLKQQGNTATIWDTTALSELSTSRGLAYSFLRINSVVLL